MGERIRVAAIQLEIVEQEPADSRRERALALVRAEAEAGAELILLPELWLSGFFGFEHYHALAEAADGHTARALAALSRTHALILVGGSIVERDGDVLYNSVLVFGRDGSLLAKYRKVHLFPVASREPELLSPGRAVVTVQTGGTRLGISTCFDLRFPELYRSMADDGVELLLVVAAWPFPRLGAWRTLSCARAIENQAALVACNAAGRQGGSRFLGHSVAYDAQGRLIAELGADPGVLRLEVDLASVRKERADFPALKCRLPWMER